MLYIKDWLYITYWLSIAINIIKLHLCVMLCTEKCKSTILHYVSFNDISRIIKFLKYQRHHPPLVLTAHHDTVPECGPKSSNYKGHTMQSTGTCGFLQTVPRNRLPPYTMSTVLLSRALKNRESPIYWHQTFKGRVSSWEIIRLLIPQNCATKHITYHQHRQTARNLFPGVV